MEVLFMRLCPWTFSLLFIKKKGGDILFFLFRSRFREKAKTESSPDMIQPAFVHLSQKSCCFRLKYSKWVKMHRRGHE